MGPSGHFYSSMGLIYETCECDIETPDIHRFPRVDGLSMGPPGFGVSHRISCMTRNISYNVA